MKKDRLGRKVVRYELIDAEIIELYKSNSLNQIAELTKSSYAAVRRVLLKNGIVVRNRGGGNIGKPRIKHGYAKKAIELGFSPSTYMRLLCVKKLGAKCIRCGISDIRVLQINHINGQNKPQTGKELNDQYLQILSGKDLPVDIRCANCNIIHEYERGNINICHEMLI